MVRAGLVVAFSVVMKSAMARLRNAKSSMS
jgi:hypothetical protein